APTDRRPLYRLRGADSRDRSSLSGSLREGALATGHHSRMSPERGLLTELTRPLQSGQFGPRRPLRLRIANPTDRVMRARRVAITAPQKANATPADCCKGAISTAII